MLYKVYQFYKSSCLIFLSFGGNLYVTMDYYSIIICLVLVMMVVLTILTIENNRFDTFDRPLLYAKSVDGLTFRNNVVKQNTDYPAFHKNNRRFWLQHVRNIIIEGNRYSDGYDPSRDYKEE